MKEMVIFDLDNTLIKGQSLKILLAYGKKLGLVSFFSYIKIMLWFALYKIGAIKNPRGMMEYGFKFLKDKDSEEVERIIAEFFKKELKKTIL